MPEVFDYVKSISYTKENLMTDSNNESGYNPYITNRALSYHQDALYIVNEMNMNHHLDKSLQYGFLLNILRKKSRFSKWSKPEESDDLAAVSEYFGYSLEKSKIALKSLTAEQVKEIHRRIEKGGIKNVK